MPETRLQSDRIEQSNVQNMSREARAAMLQRAQIAENQRDWLDYVYARDAGAFYGDPYGGDSSGEHLIGQTNPYAKYYAEMQAKQRAFQRQRFLNAQKFQNQYALQQQNVENRERYYNFVKQQEETQNQKEADKLAKLISDLQDPKSQAYKELSDVERINQINRARAKLAGIGAGPSRVHIEEVDNGLKYPDWHDKAGQPLPPDRVITYEDGKIERVNAWDDMLKGEKARAEALTAINKAQQGDLPPRFDPDAEGFDSKLRDKHIKGRRAEIEDDAKEHADRRKREKQKELADQQHELDGNYEEAFNEYEIELEEWKEQKAAVKDWEKNFPDASKAYTEATRDEYLEENPNANFVERNGKFFLYGEKPDLGVRPEKPFKTRDYTISDPGTQADKAYDDEYRRRRTELEATLEEDAKERMRVHEGSASLGMPGMGNIASMGPSMAVNPDTGHQINFEGESWA